MSPDGRAQPALSRFACVYEAYDIRGPEDVKLIGRRETFPQALEMAFRYVAAHEDPPDVSIFHWAPSVYHRDRQILWLFDPEKPEHMERLVRARLALEAGEPEDVRRGLP